MISLSSIKLDKSEIDSVTKVLKSGNLSQGKKVAELEEKFAMFCGVKYALAVNNGTAALHCALYSQDLHPGDEVITTPLTFVSTANAILMVGAKPVFADINEKDFNIDPEQIESKITKKTKVILAVNLYGQPADYEKINKIARKYDLFVIEDAAQSVGAKYKNKISGNLGDIGCFSFYATKNIMSGEGGIITTNNKSFIEKARRFRQHGEDAGKRYKYFGLGYNYRMTDILAALAVEQLKKVEEITKKRQFIAGKYDQEFKKIGKIGLNVPEDDRTHVYHQYTIKLKNRDKLKKLLYKKGIQTKVYYPIPLYKFNHLSNENSTKYFPSTEKVIKEILSIPVHPFLTDKEINYIIKCIKQYV